MSGLEACAKLRADGDRIPIILLTARTAEHDRIAGLEAGADDYLGKPFSPRELLARINAVLRRSSSGPSVLALGSGPICVGDYLFEPGSRTLSRGSETRPLNTVEYSLLAELVLNPGIAISRERLAAVSHLRSERVLTRTVDTSVMRLRRLIEPDPSAPRYIQTVRGRGYMFVPNCPVGGEVIASQSTVTYSLNPRKIIAPTDSVGSCERTVSGISQPGFCR